MAILQLPICLANHLSIPLNIKRQTGSCLKCPNTFKKSFRLYRHSIKKKNQRKTIWMCIQVQQNKKVSAKIALSSLVA